MCVLLRPPTKICARRSIKASSAAISSSGWPCFPINIPPLRERGDDISLLARHFAAELGRELSGREVDAQRIQPTGVARASLARQRART